jgi:hypothetical protein
MPSVGRSIHIETLSAAGTIPVVEGVDFAVCNLGKRGRSNRGGPRKKKRSVIEHNRYNPNFYERGKIFDGIFRRSGIRGRNGKLAGSFFGLQGRCALSFPDASLQPEFAGTLERTTLPGPWLDRTGLNRREAS